jgi:hypothetical protein
LSAFEFDLLPNFIVFELHKFVIDVAVRVNICENAESLLFLVSDCAQSSESECHQPPRRDLYPVTKKSIYQKRSQEPDRGEQANHEPSRRFRAKQGGT